MVFSIYRYVTGFILLFSMTTAVANEEQTNAAASKVDKKINPIVIFETTSGNIEIEIYEHKSPLTAKNFLKYVDDGFYNGTIFHRIVPNFVIQGGGYTYAFQKTTTRDPIIKESNNGMKNLVGTLSMARTSDPNSATSQFFINTKNNPSLDFNRGNQGYAVFGIVKDGFKVVKAIENEPRGMHRIFPEAPNTAVIITRAYRKPLGKTK